ncbi:MAG: flagellar protein FlaG [Senegalia sp. (in: firmicutes)]|uniref:flagellar protein FlaG n=1 Tax=Senegalia sp. (in: firmicutes) TaxID=1924098 RepID=UPI003F9537C5
MSVEGIAGSQMMNNRPMINKELNPKAREEDNKQMVEVSNDNGNIKEKKVSKEELIHAVNTANESLKSDNKELKYSIHKQTNTIMVKLVDSKTKETIKEMPPEKILDMVAKMWEMAGLFVDERR